MLFISAYMCDQFTKLELHFAMPLEDGKEEEIGLIRSSCVKLLCLKRMGKSKKCRKQIKVGQKPVEKKECKDGVPEKEPRKEKEKLPKKDAKEKTFMQSCCT